MFGWHVWQKYSNPSFFLMTDFKQLMQARKSTASPRSPISLEYLTVDSVFINSMMLSKPPRFRNFFIHLSLDVSSLMWSPEIFCNDGYFVNNSSHMVISSFPKVFLKKWGFESSLLPSLSVSLNISRFSASIKWWVRSTAFLNRFILCRVKKR